MLVLVCTSFSVNAIDVKQFKSYCGKGSQSKGFCDSYLGGALDAIAVMNDEAKKNNTPLYCIHESELFNTQKLAEYILSQPSRLDDKNAILPVASYLRKHGKCKK